MVSPILPFIKLSLGLMLAIGMLFLTLPGNVSAVDFTTVQPLLQKYCYDCHNPEKEEGHLDLTKYKTLDTFATDHEMLDHVQWVVAEHEMPPMKAAQPTEQERELIVALVEQSLAALTNAKPNDPGIVVMPRVNMKEYDYIVEDLTGYDLQLGQYLTPDGVGGEGFLNVGANQMMSVGQFEGFLSTAKKLMDHARVIPGADIFWSRNVMAPAANANEMKKLVREAWEDWHSVRKQELISAQEKQLDRKLDFVWEAYLEAAWQYHHRAAFGATNATFEQVAKAYEIPLFPDALEMTYQIVTRDPTLPGNDDLQKNPLIAELIRQWEALPAPQGKDLYQVRDQIKAIADWRKKASATNDYASVGPDRHLDIPVKERADAQALRGLYNKGEPRFQIDLAGDDDGQVYLAVAPVFGSEFMPQVIWKNGEVVMENGSKQPWQSVITNFTDQDGRARPFGQSAKGEAIGAGEIGMLPPGYLAFQVPNGAKELHVDLVYASEQPSGAAGVKAGPLPEAPEDYFEELAGRKYVGRRNPKFAAQMSERMERLAVMDTTNTGYTRLRDNITFRGVPQDLLAFLDVDPPKSKWSDRLFLYALSAEDIRRDLQEADQQEMEKYYNQMVALQKASTLEQAAIDQKAREIIGQTAARLWRRPPSADEIQRLFALYQADLAEGRSYEQSLKTPLVASLVAPNFLYRFTQAKGEAEPYPLSDPELATRLAFVLWGSLPDEELLQIAYQGQLANPQTLRAQIDRMIQDPRAENFIEEFKGMWLGFADFERFSGPDAEKYESFDNALKEAMHRETTLFFLDMLRTNKPITAAFDADYTFLNERLAKHYEIEGVQGDEMRLVKLDGNQRGGILGMGAFLTKTSEPLRTSPVHRGIWLYEKVLGLPIPEPPPNVPLLSDEEVNEEGLTVAQQLAQHREDPACSSCHERFDPLGVALENFDPIGRWRTTTGGKPVDSRGAFATGEVIDGLSELRQYMNERQEYFLQNFCAKLLGYTLGRSLLPTDKPVLEAMMTALKQNNYSFRSALEVAIFSPQFRMRRDEEIRPQASAQKTSHGSIATLHP